MSLQNILSQALSPIEQELDILTRSPVKCTIKPEHEMEDHNTNVGEHLFSGLSVSTARPFLPDLPQSILEDIVTFVRRSIHYDGYLCELRLVNSALSTLNHKIDA